MAEVERTEEEKDVTEERAEVRLESKESKEGREKTSEESSEGMSEARC
jgi:hypothetical protein